MQPCWPSLVEVNSRQVRVSDEKRQHNYLASSADGSRVNCVNCGSGHLEREFGAPPSSAAVSPNGNAHTFCMPELRPCKIRRLF